MLKIKYSLSWVLFDKIVDYKKTIYTKCEIMYDAHEYERYDFGVFLQSYSFMNTNTNTKLINVKSQV